MLDLSIYMKLTDGIINTLPSVNSIFTTMFKKLSADSAVIA